MEASSMMNDAPKSKFELRIDLLLNKLTNEAVKNASYHAFSCDGFDDSLRPTSLRFKKRTFIFFKMLAKSLDISFHSAVMMTLDGFAESARPPKESIEHK